MASNKIVGLVCARKCKKKKKKTEIGNMFL